MSDLPSPQASDNATLFNWAQSFTVVLQKILNVPDRKIPPGVVMLWPQSSPPDFWYACDGSAKGRKRDSPLFRVMGTTFGAGDGSTTFNLPPANLDGHHAAPTNFIWIIKA